MKKITTLIVEDNYKSQVLIKHLLEKYCSIVEIVGVASTIQEAVDLIKEFNPQLLILDIRLEDSLSFDLFTEVDCTDFEIIFTTAFDEYALKAFKYQAIDYILKPIEIDELIIAIDRCNIRLQEKLSFSSKYINRTYKESKVVKHLTIESLKKTNIINIDDIIYCESDGRYTYIYLKNNHKVIASKNLGTIEEQINDNRFFRIHHSYIVNIQHIVEITKNKSVSCSMSNNVLLPISVRRRQSLKAHLQTYL